MPSDRKVVYDSEDEDAGFSPFNSPSKGDATTNADDVALEGDGDATGQPNEGLIASETRSTDPDFFRKVYDEHQSVVTGLIPDSARCPDSNEHMGSSDWQKSSGRNAKNNSSSLTDPTLRSAKKKGNRVDRVHCASLTQVSTPRGHAPVGLRRDVYDFPSSGEEGGVTETTTANGKALATDTYSKRKRIQSVTPAKTAVSPSLAQPPSQSGDMQPTHQHDEDESPPPARKKRRSGAQQDSVQIPENVDLLVIPRTADMNESPAKPHVGNDDPDSIVPDTLGDEQSVMEKPPASFFIAPPSRLTSSQKQEYVRITGSSEHEREEELDLSLPVTQSGKIRSSEATIAYPTPSRYCSSAPPFPDQPETGEGGSSGTTASVRKKADNARMDAIMLHSSPDELNSDSPNRMLPKTKRRRGSDEDDDELAQDDAWDSDQLGVHREQYKPRPSRRRAETGPDKASDSAKKKRLKAEQTVDMANEDPWDSDKIGAHQDNYNPRPSRRRSRAVVQEDAEDTPEQSKPDTCPPGQASPGGMERMEPILFLSGQQVPREEAEVIEGIDPDYLAALPGDLRQEVISDHLARNAQASRTRGRGRPKQPLRDLVATSEETPQPKKRGRKKKELLGGELVDAEQEAEARAIPASVAPTKRKRGRPKKSETLQLAPATAADDDISFAYEAEDIPQTVDEPNFKENKPAEFVQEAPVSAKAPSKRGRKKKVVEESPMVPEGEPTEVVAEEVTPSEPVQAIPETTKASSKRGRKKKVVEERPAALEERPQEGHDTARDSSFEPDKPADLPLKEHNEPVEEAGASRLPLQDISNTTSSKEAPEADADTQKEVTSEAKEKETAKSASSTTGQGQGKVPFRVGLSKRSRIAPLLKIIRK
ncbi:hypothetical protein VP1G_00594 [Cytospora mali]|uniref:AT hook domain-containing protein n=1 Tax=Cytospora mali TaxID=578113 RepID=A0A194UNY2_CYTMA|nr:hypothetical protein VP1G_00594 [Valsa mali var. pyri (nom. inval.)]